MFIYPAKITSLKVYSTYIYKVNFYFSNGNVKCTFAVYPAYVKQQILDVLSNYNSDRIEYVQVKQPGHGNCSNFFCFPIYIDLIRLGFYF